MPLPLSHLCCWSLQPQSAVGNRKSIPRTPRRNRMDRNQNVNLPRSSARQLQPSAATNIGRTAENLGLNRVSVKVILIALWLILCCSVQRSHAVPVWQRQLHLTLLCLQWLSSVYRRKRRTRLSLVFNKIHLYYYYYYYYYYYLTKICLVVHPTLAGHRQ